MGRTVSPPHSQQVEALTPSSSVCNTVWRPGLYRANQVKMRPLDWFLIPYDWRLYANRKSVFQTQKLKEKVMQKTQGNIIYKLRREARNRSVRFSLWKEPTQPWFWTFNLQTGTTIHLSSNPPNMWYFITAASANWYMQAPLALTSSMDHRQTTASVFSSAKWDW